MPHFFFFSDFHFIVFLMMILMHDLHGQQGFFRYIEAERWSLQLIIWCWIKLVDLRVDVEGFLQVNWKNDIICFVYMISDFRNSSCWSIWLGSCLSILFLSLKTNLSLVLCLLLLLIEKDGKFSLMLSFWG